MVNRSRKAGVKGCVKGKSGHKLKPGQRRLCLASKQCQKRSGKPGQYATCVAKFMKG